MPNDDFADLTSASLFLSYHSARVCWGALPIYDRCFHLTHVQSTTMGESRWKKTRATFSWGTSSASGTTTGVKNILLFLSIQPPPPVHQAKSERRRVRTVYFICYRRWPFFFFFNKFFITIASRHALAAHIVTVFFLRNVNVKILLMVFRNGRRYRRLAHILH